MWYKLGSVLIEKHNMSNVFIVGRYLQPNVDFKFYQYLIFNIENAWIFPLPGCLFEKAYNEVSRSFPTRLCSSLMIWKKYTRIIYKYTYVIIYIDASE